MALSDRMRAWQADSCRSPGLARRERRGVFDEKPHAAPSAPVVDFELAGNMKRTAPMRQQFMAERGVESAKSHGPDLALRVAPKSQHQVILADRSRPCDLHARECQSRCGCAGTVGSGRVKLLHEFYSSCARLHGSHEPERSWPDGTGSLSGKEFGEPVHGGAEATARHADASGHRMTAPLGKQTLANTCGDRDAEIHAGNGPAGTLPLVSVETDDERRPVCQPHEP